MENKRMRPHQVLLRLNDEELDLLDKKVELAGARSRMDLLRHLIVYGSVFKIDLSNFIEYNTLLAHIDKHLNEIAYNVKSSGNIHADEVAEIRKDVDKLWQLQGSMLSKVPSLRP